MSYTDILKTIPTLSSAALLKENIRVASKKKYRSGDMAKLASKNIFGSALITEQAKLIG